MERKDDQVLIRLLPSQRLGLIKLNENLAKLLPQSSSPDEWQGQRIAFSLGADGKMIGPDSIVVTGPVAAGQTTEKKRIPSEEAAGADRVLYDGAGPYVLKQVTRYDAKTVT